LVDSSRETPPFAPAHDRHPQHHHRQNPQPDNLNISNCLARKLAFEEEKEAGDGEEESGPKTAEDITADLTELIARELDVPSYRSQHAKKPSIIFKNSITSKILEAECPNTQQRLYAMIWLVGSSLSIEQLLMRKM